MFHDMIIMGSGRYDYHNFMITAQPYLQCHIPLYGVPDSLIKHTVRYVVLE